jgi:hypothetical protein
LFLPRGDVGDYIGSATALGSITSEMVEAGDLPDFRVVVLWFHPAPSDSTAVMQAKARLQFAAVSDGEYGTRAPERTCILCKERELEAPCFCGAVLGKHDTVGIRKATSFNVKSYFLKAISFNVVTRPHHS